jgi:2-polyprenyl-3-methyl-5-hydroxy-6-metoxy-1,4-benzoquinol methylase
LFKDTLRSLFGGSRGSNGAAPPARNSLTQRSQSAGKHGEKETITNRQSRGLEQFFNYVRDQTGLTILDLGGASQANVSFITNLGHRLYSVDSLRSMEETFGQDGADQSNAGRIEFFLRQTLDYPDDYFDGVLAWDILEHMGPALLAATLDRLYHVLKPKSYMLAFFNNDERLTTLPYHVFRIQDFNFLQVAQHGSHSPAQVFNNRALEKMFQRFESVKFFLTRENLSEVIVKR